MAIFWTFLGPAVCMWFFGFLTPSGSGLAPVTVVHRDPHSQVAATLVSALRQSGHTVTEADHPIPGGLSVEVSTVTSDSPVPAITLHASNIETKEERSLKYEIEADLAKLPAIQRTAPPSSFQRTVPAYLIMFLTMNLLMSGAGFAEERASGRMRRLLTAPIGALTVVTGRLTSRLVIAWLQMLVLFSIGVFVLRIHWAQHAAGLILILSLYVLAMGSVGLLIGSCIRDPDQAMAFAMWAALLIAPLTGLWWPIELMPGPLQTVSHWLPTGWVMQSVNLMLASGASLAQFPLTLVGLLSIAVAAMWFSTRRLAS